MDSRRDAAEETHHIHGTVESFSSKPDDLDEKATEKLREIIKNGSDGLEVLSGIFRMNPPNLPKGFFLSEGMEWWERSIRDHFKQTQIWREHGPSCGYAIGHHASGYEAMKMTYIHRNAHNGYQKTNWNMVVYSLIGEDSTIEADNVVLCHVFQSASRAYDPRPKRVPDSSDFDQTLLKSQVEELENLMNNPKAFMDLEEFNGRHSKCARKRKESGRNGKRAKVWEHFTNIRVVRTTGEVMLTLPICHGCSMSYLTGKWDFEEGSLSNNGTKTLTKHYSKCRDQQDIAGNPQGAHLQMS